MTTSSLRTGGLAAALLALTAAPALAHTGAGPAHGIMHGFAHPIGGLDHLLAMVAVGLWAAQRGGRALWLLPVAFVASMVAGGALGALGVGALGVETGIVLSVLVLGVLVAMAVRLPLAASVGVVALFALFHGHAHGAEMPAGVSGAAYAAGFAASTALLHGFGVVAALAMRRLPALGAAEAPWVRVAGAGICAAGMVLMLV